MSTFRGYREPYNRIRFVRHDRRYHPGQSKYEEERYNTRSGNDNVSDRHQDFRDRERYGSEEERYRHENGPLPDQGGWYGDSERHVESERHRGGKAWLYPERTYPNPPGHLPREDEGYFSPDYSRYYNDDEDYVRARRARQRDLPEWGDDDYPRREY